MQITMEIELENTLMLATDIQLIGVNSIVMHRSFDQLDSTIISFELMEMKHFELIVVKDNWLVSF